MRVSWQWKYWGAENSAENSCSLRSRNYKEVKDVREKILEAEKLSYNTFSLTWKKISDKNGKSKKKICPFPKYCNEAKNVRECD